MEAAIAPFVEEEQLRLEVARIGLSSVGRIVTEVIIYLSNGVLNKIFHSFLGRVGKREIIEVSTVHVRNVHPVGQERSSRHSPASSSDNRRNGFVSPRWYAASTSCTLFQSTGRVRASAFVRASTRNCRRLAKSEPKAW